VTGPGAVRAAFRLFVRNLALLAAIVLTVSIPVNVVAGAVERWVLGPTVPVQAMQVSIVLDALLSPISAGAVVHALAVLRGGERASYGAAMRVGLGNAGRLFKANVYAGALILLGFLAGIVPGVLLAIRWALIDPVVVLEQAGARAARRRSAELSRGRRGTIAVALVLCLVAVGLPTLGAYGVVYAILALDAFPVDVALDGGLDVLYTVVQIVVFLFYCASRERELAAAPPAAA
jgi:hypothetical protein